MRWQLYVRASPDRISIIPIRPGDPAKHPQKKLERSPVAPLAQTPSLEPCPEKDIPISTVLSVEERPAGFKSLEKNRSFFSQAYIAKPTAGG
jgi:hypothetical protein